MLLEQSVSAASDDPGPINRAKKIKASAEIPRSTAEKPRWSAENPRWSAENPRSLPLAIASLSFKEEDQLAAIAKDGASAENPPSTAEIPRSGSGSSVVIAGKEDRTANGSGWTMSRPIIFWDKKKRLEAERRYSGGLLPRVIQCSDFLPEKHITCDSAPPLSRRAGGDSSPPLSRGTATESVAWADSSPPYQGVRRRKPSLRGILPPRSNPTHPSMSPCPRLA